MTSLFGHITAGVAGSTIAAVVLESGNFIAASALIGLCLCFVGAQLFQAQDGTRA